LGTDMVRGLKNLGAYIEDDEEIQNDGQAKK
jgi:hypothetical protein